MRSRSKSLISPEQSQRGITLALVLCLGGCATPLPKASSTQHILAATEKASAHGDAVEIPEPVQLSSNLPDKVAAAIDTQMDDGAMQTGMVRSSGPQATPNPALAALPGGNTTYVENGTNQYTICKQL